jgi:hypothetical protein
MLGLFAKRIKQQLGLPEAVVMILREQMRGHHMPFPGDLIDNIKKGKNMSTFDQDRSEQANGRSPFEIPLSEPPAGHAVETVNLAKEPLPDHGNVENGAPLPNFDTAETINQIRGWRNS